jgi:hypothetical protein
MPTTMTTFKMKKHQNDGSIINEDDWNVWTDRPSSNIQHNKRTPE